MPGLVDQPLWGYYSLSPTLIKWISNDQFVFASERSGYSHLYVFDNGNIKALTQGNWEVRDAVLLRDKKKWLITAGKESPTQDHLYQISANGGKVEKISELIGRNNGVVSPNGKLVAIINSNNRQLSDLYLKNIGETGEGTRITVSGS